MFKQHGSFMKSVFQLCFMVITNKRLVFSMGRLSVSIQILYRYGVDVKTSKILLENIII